jgi:HK97 family phage prohead protease
MPQPRKTDAPDIPQDVERRFTGGPELASVRIETREDGKEVIVGLGAVYYDGTRRTEYEVWPGVRERITPGAFARLLGESPDVRGLYNHDPNHVLGRTSKGTMTLRDTDAGLEYEIDPPDTTSARDVLALLKRGDVDGSSFSFSNQTEDRIPDGDDVIYEMSDFGRVYDVGPVTFPAYQATTAGATMRSMQTQRTRPDVQDEDESAGAYENAEHAQELIKAYARPSDGVGE